MTKEEIYENVMGHKPNKEFGIKGSFGWGDIEALMDAVVKNCSIPIVTPRYFYVVDTNSEEGLDQISIGLESLERAKEFKDSEYHKKTYPNSFIVCTFNEG